MTKRVRDEVRRLDAEATVSKRGDLLTVTVGRWVEDGDVWRSVGGGSVLVCSEQAAGYRTRYSFRVTS